jgi:hypothetical protein
MQTDENLRRKGGEKNEKGISLITNLLLSSTLFWGVPSADGEEESSSFLPIPRAIAT